MATEEELRHEIRDLEQQLRILSKQQEKRLHDLEEKHRQIIARMELELRQTIESNQRRIDAVYDQRVRALQEQLKDEMIRQIDAIRHENEISQIKRQAVVTRLQDRNQQLRDELEEIKNKEKQRSQKGRTMATELYSRAEAQVKTVGNMPHGFFFPGQLDVFREHLSSVQGMLRSGMYDAATAAADSSLAELEILELDIHESLRKWEEIYTEYCGLISQMKQLLDSFESQPIQTRYGAIMLREGDWAYWSGGVYGQVKNKIMDAYRVLEEVETVGGVSAYLCKGKGLQEFQMNQQIISLHRLSEQFTAATSCIRAERYYSDERFFMAACAEEVLRRKGFRLLSGGFRGDDWEEPNEVYDLEMTHNGEDVIKLSFVPQRENGQAIGNICILSLSIRSIPSEWVYRNMADDIIAPLQSEIPHLRVEWFRSDNTQIETVEQRIKQHPDVMQLAHRLELRYQ